MNSTVQTNVKEKAEVFLVKRIRNVTFMILLLNIFIVINLSKIFNQSDISFSIKLLPLMSILILIGVIIYWIVSFLKYKDLTKDKLIEVSYIVGGTLVITVSSYVIVALSL